MLLHSLAESCTVSALHVVAKHRSYPVNAPSSLHARETQETQSMVHVCCTTQEATEADLDSEKAGHTVLQLVWALHALVDTNRANLLSLQAAGGIQLLVHLLAQASPQPPLTGPPTPSLPLKCDPNLQHGPGPVNVRLSSA